MSSHHSKSNEMKNWLSSDQNLPELPPEDFDVAVLDVILPTILCNRMRFRHAAA
jgi:hypothetical protein